MANLFGATAIGSQSSLEVREPLSVKHAPRRVVDFLCDRPRRIMSAFIADPRPDAFYFLGPSGLGKTEMALAMAREIVSRCALWQQAIYNELSLGPDEHFSIDDGRGSELHIRS